MVAEGFIIAATHFESIPIGLWSGVASILQVAVPPGPAVFQDGGGIVAVPQVSVPSVIAILPGPAPIEIVVDAHIHFGGKPIGVGVVGRVGVIPGIAVDDLVVVGTRT